MEETSTNDAEYQCARQIIIVSALVNKEAADSNARLDASKIQLWKQEFTINASQSYKLYGPNNNNRKYKTKEDQAKSVQHLDQTICSMTKHAHTICNQS
jgi:hypothetical protein